MKKLRKQILNRSFILVVIMFFTANGCLVKKEEYGTSLFTFFCSKTSDVKIISHSDFEGAFIFNTSDTAFYNFGYNVSTLTENIPELVILPDISDEELQTIVKENHDQKYFSNVRGYDADRLKKQNVFFTFHDHQIWKYSKPIDTMRKGMIGVYVDSLVTDNRGVIRFNFYFNNVNKLSYMDADAIINSIRMKNQSIKKTDFYMTNIRE